ncbi:sodium/hydrogen exchanger 9B2-like isoform X2 [Hemicordylus capensis]|uniref:sodium/hydrogen exchanger 9B2-like isoform X2 n=1 Tax=Hemicordylus capensis TaxID=884348 RepID=UPI0023030288|nr:sodium/hydrogen exchanger 9B2-like isoform X2 [Hemicordylus capensis]
MGEDTAAGREDVVSSVAMSNHDVLMHQTTQGSNRLDSKAANGNRQTEETALLNNSGQQPPKLAESKTSGKLRQIWACPPQGIAARTVTHVAAAALVWAVGWSITGRECLPGGNLFGILFLFFFAVIGGKIMGLIKLPGLPPPLPPLLGMLLVGFLLRNVPGFSDIVRIDVKWSASLRNIALSIILARSGLALDPKALKKLKAVCLRLSLGPCVIEACAAAVLAHFLMHLPWPWGFMLGFVLGAVSPAVVVPSMLILQAGGYGVDKGVPTLLMASGSFDDILAITGFNTCLGMAFSSGSTLDNILRGFLEVAIGITTGGLLGIFVHYFPSKDQRKIEEIVGVAWEIFQPFLFGLIGAEISITSLVPETVGLCVATLSIALLVRIIATFLMVCCAGFDIKEKVFISLAWIPKATVQAAIGSVALDTARVQEDQKLEQYGMNVLTVAFLSILITAPVGALIIGLAGPKLLHKAADVGSKDPKHGRRREEEEEIETSGWV